MGNFRTLFVRCWRRDVAAWCCYSRTFAIKIWTDIIGIRDISPSTIVSERWYPLDLGCSALCWFNGLYTSAKAYIIFLRYTDLMRVFSFTIKACMFLPVVSFKKSVLGHTSPRWPNAGDFTDRPKVVNPLRYEIKVIGIYHQDCTDRRSLEKQRLTTWYNVCAAFKAWKSSQ